MVPAAMLVIIMGMNRVSAALAARASALSLLVYFAIATQILSL